MVSGEGEYKDFPHEEAPELFKRKERKIRDY